MHLRLLQVGSVLWAWLMRYVAAFGHLRRAMARVAIRHEGQTAVLAHRGAPLMWFHVASLGELEQAIPVMQAHRKAHPETPWLLTVYSPSAWHPLQSKKPDGWRDGDLLAVLPDDFPWTWKTWLSQVPIRALALAKYDLWPNLLVACRREGIPVHAFAAAPSKATPSTPALWNLIDTISVQDDRAAAAFAGAGIAATHIDGDPRVERVLTRAANPGEPWKVWASNTSQVVVAGSTWQEEEQALRTLDWHPQRRLVLVPHDISERHLNEVDALWGGGAIRASAWLAFEPAEREKWSVVVVDSTGMLFDLYRIGTVAVVGGGHGSGLHNVLEPASAGLPIVTGPELGGFREAHALQDLGALSAGDVADLTNAWLADARSCAQFGEQGRKWLESQQGASARIMARWG